MKPVQSLSRSQRILVISLTGIGLLSAVRIIEYNPIPWEWVVAFALGTLILVGPVQWTLRSRLSAKRRENLTYVVGGIALLCVPIVLGLGLVFGNLLLVMDAGVLGGVTGLGVTLVINKLVRSNQRHTITP